MNLIRDFNFSSVIESLSQNAQSFVSKLAEQDKKVAIVATAAFALFTIVGYYVYKRCCFKGSKQQKSAILQSGLLEDKAELQAKRVAEFSKKCAGKKIVEFVKTYYKSVENKHQLFTPGKTPSISRTKSSLAKWNKKIKTIEDNATSEVKEILLEYKKALEGSFKMEFFLQLKNGLLFKQDGE